VRVRSVPGLVMRGVYLNDVGEQPWLVDLWCFCFYFLFFVFLRHHLSLSRQKRSGGEVLLFHGLVWGFRLGIPGIFLQEKSCMHDGDVLMVGKNKHIFGFLRTYPRENIIFFVPHKICEKHKDFASLLQQTNKHYTRCTIASLDYFPSKHGKYISLPLLFRSVTRCS